MAKITRNQIPITIEYDGKQYQGSYYKGDRMIVVSTPYGSKPAQVGNTPVARLAQMLFRELLDKAKEQGEL